MRNLIQGGFLNFFWYLVSDNRRSSIIRFLYNISLILVLSSVLHKCVADDDCEFSDTNGEADSLDGEADLQYFFDYGNGWNGPSNYQYVVSFESHGEYEINIKVRDERGSESEITTVMLIVKQNTVGTSILIQISSSRHMGSSPGRFRCVEFDFEVEHSQGFIISFNAFFNIITTRIVATHYQSSI